jgi:hypothetical protein
MGKKNKYKYSLISPPQHTLTANNPATGFTPALAAVPDNLDLHFLRQATERLASIFAPAARPEAVLYVFLCVLAAAIRAAVSHDSLSLLS